MLQLHEWYIDDGSQGKRQDMCSRHTPAISQGDNPGHLMTNSHLVSGAENALAQLLFGNYGKVLGSRRGLKGERAWAWP